jgi:molecular chaperone HtpG
MQVSRTYLVHHRRFARETSPQLNRCGKNRSAVDVDRIDEWMAGYLTEYAARSCATSARLGVVARLKELLGERVSDVKVSRRLTESPSCLVLDEYDMALHLRRVLKQSGHDMPDSAPVLEINPAHALVKRLEAETDDSRAADLALLLLEQAQVAEGAQLDDPAAFVQRLNRVILGAGPDAAVGKR